MAKTSPAPSLTDLSWLEQLSFEQLSTLIAATQAQLDSKRQHEKELLRHELLEKARLLGIDPAELLPAHKGRGGTRNEVKPKYRDKRDPSLTWSGRGRPPRWLQERLDAGEDRNDYLIR
jgi:DNA-binding protein H-NS